MNLKCPRCKTEMFPNGNIMTCPACGFNVGTDIDFKKKKIKNEKVDNLRQGKKFELGAFV